MTVQERNQIRNLIPDLQPADHVSLNTKRINFIYGQGVVIYNESYAVEVYVPKNRIEEMTFFAVDRHFGKTSKLGDYYRRLPVLSYDHKNVNKEMRNQFDEAIFMNMSDGSNLKGFYNSRELKQVA